MQFDPTKDAVCDHPGCGQRIVPSEIPGGWAHWPDAESPVTVIGLEGGRHAALPPEGA